MEPNMIGMPPPVLRTPTFGSPLAGPGIHWFGPGGSGVFRPPVGLRPPGIPNPGPTPADHMHGLVAHSNARQAAARAALRARPRFF